MATEVVLFYFRHRGTTAALPADDLADYVYTLLFVLTKILQKNVINIRLKASSNHHHSQEMIITTLMSAQAKSFQQCQKKLEGATYREQYFIF